MHIFAAFLVLVVAALCYIIRHQQAVSEHRRSALVYFRDKYEKLLTDHTEAVAEREELRWQLEASNFMLETALKEANLGEHFRIPLPQDHERKKKVEQALKEIESIPETIDSDEIEYTEIYSDFTSEPVAVLTTGPIPRQRDAGNGQAYFKEPA